MKSVNTQNMEKSLDGRKLDHWCLPFFKNGFAPLSMIAEFDSRSFRNDKKITEATHRIVCTTPILRTKVVGDVDDARFVFTDQCNWPTVEIHSVHSDDEVIQQGREIVSSVIESLSGNREAQRTSARIHIIRGGKKQTRIAIAIICPHHFLDGCGIAVLIAKLCLYVTLPKLLWTFIDRMNPKEVPTFDEMIGISYIDQVENKESLVSTSPRFNPQVFKFDYNIENPSDPGKDLIILKKKYATLPEKTILQCRKILHSQGITITTVFAALSMKLCARILDRYKMNPDEKPLLSLIPIDARTFDEIKKGKYQFPVAASYAFNLSTLVQYKSLVNKPLVDIAVQLKQGISEVRNDTTVRVREYLAPRISPGFGNVTYLLGTSSGRVPGIINANIEAEIKFGRVPHVWFNIATFRKITTIAFDFALPFLPDLTEQIIEEELSLIIKGSALESLFPTLCSED